MTRFIKIAKDLYYFFPVQLFINHLKRNHVILLCWVVLILFISGQVGNYLGIPYLFLDPEYLNQVDFTSFFIVGIVLAGFSIAFHITTYIMDGHRFSFIGTQAKPFTKFSLNNSLIPFAFLIFYILSVIKYQNSNEYISERDLWYQIGGLLTGYFLMTFVLYLYFWFTNKDIFKYVVCKLDEKLKQNIKLTRASAIKKLTIARKKQIPVNHFLDLNFKVRKTIDFTRFYDKSSILQVFDQNHFNLVIMEVFVFILILTMGIFKDYPYFQLPAAASFILFLTVFLIFAGAFTYWFGRWSFTVALILFLAFNALVEKDFFTKTYKAFGLDYDVEPAIYSIDEISEVNSSPNQLKDKQTTLQMLNNWLKKFPESSKPKLVIASVSGGGQRSALWTLNVLQKADSATNKQLLNHTTLITGASGGLIGAAYFRELYLRRLDQKMDDILSNEFLDNISTDNLNPIIFSLLANDLFVGFQKFKYNGKEYLKDRGYSFEEQLNKNTEYILDKSITDYAEDVKAGRIPMMIIGPTIINDGRKLYISSQSVSYMGSYSSNYALHKQSGVDFLRFFENQNSKDLRFLSALRMSATFPYISPNTKLPSTPAMKIMDSGIKDNFGISDAVRFIDVFKDWINENTSGVILLSIRDSQKNSPIDQEPPLNIFERLFLPISSIYQNFENMQTINNDLSIEYAREWLNGSLNVIDIQYVPDEAHKQNLTSSDSLRMRNVNRASLSWRLTSREKESLKSNIYTENNLKALQKLQRLLSTPLNPLYVASTADENKEDTVN